MKLRELTIHEKIETIEIMIYDLSNFDENTELYLCNKLHKLLYKYFDVNVLIEKGTKTVFKETFPEFLNMIMEVGSELRDGGVYNIESPWFGYTGFKDEIDFKIDKLNILLNELQS